MIATIRRIEQTEQGTIGVLLLDRKIQCLTLEKHWRNNEPNISCIPPGNYTCQRITSQKFGQTYEVQNVPGRSSILFHAGNTYADTQGCILVGNQVGHLNGYRAVLESRHAFENLMQELFDCLTFSLLVVEDFG